MVEKSGDRRGAVKAGAMLETLEEQGSKMLPRPLALIL